MEEGFTRLREGTDARLRCEDREEEEEVNPVWKVLLESFNDLWYSMSIYDIHENESEPVLYICKMEKEKIIYNGSVQCTVRLLRSYIRAGYVGPGASYMMMQSKWIFSIHPSIHPPVSTKAR